MASHNSLRRMSLGDVPCSVMNNEYLIWEVLVHLPTKSLMRFKCVSKLWYSIIRNSKFAKAHKQSSGGGFHGFLITNFYDNLIWCSRQPIKFLYANLNDCPGLMHRQLTIHQQEYTSSTIVVNGLIGLYDNGDNFFTLCNIATHESIDLPQSPSLINSAYSDIDIYNTDYYYLGYDPVDEVFKVLNMCLSYDGNNELMDGVICHVFTFGVNGSDMKWRNIMSSSDSDLESQQCMCINGALYWLEVDFKKTLTRFKLNNETFQMIRIPECMDFAELIEICGSPALLVLDSVTDSEQWLDIWTMNSHSTGDELEAWTRKRVLLRNLDYSFSLLSYGGTLPTGEMVLFEPEFDFPLTIYIFNHLKTTLASIIVDGYESQESELDRRWKICNFEENIISLECLISKSTAASDIKHKLKMKA